MARAEIQVIQALRDTASCLERTETYQWGHMGKCNCGYLAQVVTRRTPRQIHAAAMQGSGDWSEQLNDHCPTTGMDMLLLIDELLVFGFDREDLAYLERLADPKVLASLPEGRKSLRHNQKEDVITYIRGWARQLEGEWLSAQPAVKLTSLIDGEAETEKVYSLSLHYPG